MTGASEQHAQAVDDAVVRSEIFTVGTARRVAAMLGRDPDQWREGDALPSGWQFPLLAADTRRSDLRADGFPGLGVPLPDLGLPRLMILGRAVRFHADVVIGRPLRRTSRVHKLSQKEGPTGPSAIVTIAHDIAQVDDGPPILTETQTYILLSAAPPPTPTGEPIAPQLPALTKRVTPDDTLLFQYSALGFNSHRIHLDRAYAKQVEGFADLVVNGGLTTLLLTEFFAEATGRRLTSLTARYTAPLFSGRSITLGVEPLGETWLLKAFDDAGRIAVSIEATSR